MKNKKLPLVQEIRAIKTKKEIEKIIQAQRIAEAVLIDALAYLRKGISEKEVADFIQKDFRKKRITALSFSPIVAFGEGSADIHHVPGKRKLKVGDIIMLDFGCAIDHYCSDMTRSFFFGNPSAKQKKIYSLVLEAQTKAINLIMKGEKKAGKIDAIARNFLGKKFPGNFQHGLGHGVGTVIHEWPNFKPKSSDVLKAGIVMTVEPGLYFKGFGGIRIEDMLLITEKGAINLTNFSKDLESIILPI